MAQHRAATERVCLKIMMIRRCAGDRGTPLFRGIPPTLSRPQSAALPGTLLRVQSVAGDRLPSANPAIFVLAACIGCCWHLQHLARMGAVVIRAFMKKNINDVHILPPSPTGQCTHCCFCLNLDGYGCYVIWHGSYRG